MKIRVRGKYDYDIWPVTDFIITIDQGGNDVPSWVDAPGTLDVPFASLGLIRQTMKFEGGRLVPMNEEDLLEVGFDKDKLLAYDRVKTLNDELASLDHFTHKFVEGNLSDEQWQQIVRRRQDLREMITALSDYTAVYERV